MKIRKSKDYYNDEEWHKWYAWKPVIVYDDKLYEHWIWLEWIERKKSIYGGSMFYEWSWSYRMIPEEEMGKMNKERPELSK